MRSIDRKNLLKQVGIITFISVVILIFFVGLAKFSTDMQSCKNSYEIENFANCINQSKNEDANNYLQSKHIVSSLKSSSEKGIISTFTTDYSASPTSRKHNIRLALASLDGVVIHSGEELSFNKIVGERTEERGYQKALVIFKGNYTKGVGGGVCQVSSTLYNAWLFAGLDVVSVQAHTLPASYVDLSRDATVSEWIDLVLKNPRASDVQIKTSYNDETITINIVGEKREYDYSLKTEVLKVIPPKEDVYELDEIGEDEYFEGKDGYQSRLILTISKNGRKIASRVIRNDYYMPQNIVKIVRKSIVN